MTLHNDLNKRIHERLRLWIRDSMALYDMAGLDTYTGFTDIVAALLNGLIGGFMAEGITEEQALRVVNEAVRRAYAQARHDGIGYDP